MEIKGGAIEGCRNLKKRLLLLQLFQTAISILPFLYFKRQFATLLAVKAVADNKEDAA